jgi:hypothetical protein
VTHDGDAARCGPGGVAVRVHRGPATGAVADPSAGGFASRGGAFAGVPVDDGSARTGLGATAVT